MSHLGERLTALVDGELSGDARDRALVHLAACDECRAEADRMRAVKRRLSSLRDTMPSAGLMERLQAMGEPGDPVPPRVRRLPGQPRPAALARPRDTRPRRAAAVRRRHIVVGVATIAVLGMGSAAFAAGSDSSHPLPKVSPQVEQFAVQHSLISGDTPLTDPGHP